MYATTAVLGKCVGQKHCAPYLQTPSLTTNGVSTEVLRSEVSQGCNVRPSPCAASYTVQLYAKVVSGPMDSMRSDNPMVDNWRCPKRTVARIRMYVARTASLGRTAAITERTAVRALYVTANAYFTF